MDSDQSASPADNDELIIEQLRAYADALAPRADTNDRAAPADGEPATVHGANYVRDRRLRSFPILAAAAVLLAAVAGWMLWQPDNPIATDTVDTSTTTSVGTNTTESDGPGADEEDPNTDQADLSAPRLLPSPDRWAVIAYYGPDEESRSASDGDGVWAWRLDGIVHILVEGYHSDDLGPLENADVEVDNNRATIGWVAVDGTSFGLQSIDDRAPAARAAALRSVAASLEATAEGWALPGAEILAAERSVPYRGQGEQVDLAPVDDNGNAGLRSTVSATARPGSPGSLYGELFEASSLGTVDEVTVAGQVGFVTQGPFASHAITYGQGRVTSWQSNDPAFDMASVVSSVDLVDDETWQRAIDAIDQTVAAAFDAAVAADPKVAGGSEEAAAANPPRYLLPEPWKLEIVTDMGIWTDEQWAQRRALDKAHATPGGRWELLRTQGFRRVDSPAAAPVAVPEFVIRVHATDELREFESMGEARPLTVAGWDGVSDTFRLDNTTATTIWAFDGTSTLEITAPGISQADIEAFAAGLERRGTTMADGLDASDRYEPVVDIAGEGGNGSSFRTRWLAFYADNASADGPIIQAEAIDYQQFLLRLAPYQGSDLPDYQLVDDGRFLVVDEGTRFSSLLHYDADREVLTDVGQSGATTEELVELFDSLEPVDLEVWIDIVTPYNADPTKPR